MILIAPGRSEPGGAAGRLARATLAFLEQELARDAGDCWVVCHMWLFRTVMGDPRRHFPSAMSAFHAKPDDAIRELLAGHANARLWLSGHTRSPLSAPGLIKRVLLAQGAGDRRDRRLRARGWQAPRPARPALLALLDQPGQDDRGALPAPSGRALAKHPRHVFARGNDKRLIYRDDLDRRMYIAMLRGTVRQRWRLLSYCLMENHVHLLVETPEANLGDGMQRMHSLYALEFNKRHRRSGHLFQGRYGAVRIKTDEQLWAVAAYIATNPVSAGLCAMPADWRWSSHSAVLEGEGADWLDVSRLLTYFGCAGGDPRKRRCAEMCEPRRR